MFYGSADDVVDDDDDDGDDDDDDDDDEHGNSNNLGSLPASALINLASLACQEVAIEQ